MLRLILNLYNLDARHPGLSTGIAASFSEAAAVCLARHHSSPVDMAVERRNGMLAVAAWQVPDDRTRRAWANEIDATEAGAYCVALAVVELTDNLVAVSRAETRTGVDYYLGPKDQALDDLESTHRLEVSGIDEGGSASVKSRVQQKLTQAAKGSSSLPAMAAVVAFSLRQVVIAEVAEA